mmetsp:Transcript_33902/g.50831  ORF Transcript_33902/g.50831 Transcript_33902/m.50831 type:complete len:111 (-) Transcript_33902:658-990(-)
MLLTSGKTPYNSECVQLYMCKCSACASASSMSMQSEGSRSSCPSGKHIAPINSSLLHALPMEILQATQHPFQQKTTKLCSNVIHDYMIAMKKDEVKSMASDGELLLCALG